MKYLLMVFAIITSSLEASQNSALLFHGNCTACHFETKSVSAPAMMEVRKRCLTAFGDKKDFIKQMVQWVHKPNEERSIMQDAIDKYGLMPNLTFEKDVLQDIAEYIYKTDFTKKHSRH